MITTFAASGASQMVLAPKRERWGLTMYNDVTGAAYVVFDGGAATTGNYTFRLEASGFYEMPPDYYDGQVNVAYGPSDLNGSLHVTEWTK